MALDDDMTTPPEEPDSGTPADRAAGTIGEDQYLGRDSLADLEADGGADGVAGTGDGAGADDATTASDEDPRLA